MCSVRHNIPVMLTQSPNGWFIAVYRVGRKIRVDTDDFDDLTVICVDFEGMILYHLLRAWVCVSSWWLPCQWCSYFDILLQLMVQWIRRYKLRWKVEILVWYLCHLQSFMSLIHLRWLLPRVCYREFWSIECMISWSKMFIMGNVQFTRSKAFPASNGKISAMVLLQRVFTRLKSQHV